MFKLKIGSTLKRKEFAPRRANSCYKSRTPLQISTLARSAGQRLTVKVAADNTLFFFTFYLSKKIRLYEVLLSLKNNKTSIYECRLLQL